VGLVHGAAAKLTGPDNEQVVDVAPPDVVKLQVGVSSLALVGLDVIVGAGGGVTVPPL
jgi:hypothetical protein